jgi:Skp family chaperone for outer membrane proteins
MRTRKPLSRLMTLLPVLAALVAGALLTACPRRHDVAAELEAQIARYRTEPSDTLAARIDASFARLDADVAEIRADAATKTGEAQAAALARADALEAKGSELRKSYYGVRVDVAAEAAKNAVKQFGASVGKTIEDAGSKMKDALDGGEKAE